MPKTAAILHSPLSPKMMDEDQNRALLLQIILNDIFHAHRDFEDKNLDCLGSPAPLFFPFDWSYPICSLQKTREHLMLLHAAFPETKKKLQAFEKSLKKTLAILEKENGDKLSSHFISLLKALFRSVEPFISICKENENLVYFLLEHRSHIDKLMDAHYLYSFLLKLFPKGLKGMCKRMSDRYYARGFQTVIPQIKALVAELEEDHERYT